MPISIRPYRESDLEPLARLFTESVHGLGADHYDEAQLAAWAPRPPDAGAWRERLRELETLVAVAGEDLAGFVAFGRDGYIAYLYTSPSHARRGVASMLCGRAESLLAAGGAGLLFTEASLAARGFFERQGFVVTAEQRVERGGIELVRYAMSKRMCRDESRPAPM